MSYQQQLRDKVNDQIVESLEGGVRPWRRPWRADENSGFPVNVVSKKAYRGVNPILLFLASNRHGFASKRWGTFNQWRQLGGQVMRRPSDVPEGRWGTTIVFWSKVVGKQRDDEGDERDDGFFLMKAYTVFNVDQVEGDHLDHLRAGADDPGVGDVQEGDYRHVEEAVAAIGVKILHGGDQAFYSPAHDHIRLPSRGRFETAADQALTLLHEGIHATEHPSRLDWSRKIPENSYGMGELIAELGACYLAGEFGVPVSEDLGQQAAYLAHWLAAMRADSRFIFKASGQASRAADYILSFKRQHETGVDQAVEVVATA